jgi:excisionase family DNA binding protein
MPDRELLTIPEASDRLRISARSVWNLISSGRLATVRPAGLRRTLVPREAVEALLQAENAPPRARGADDAE